MRSPLDALMTYLATIDGARPMLFVTLLWAAIYPRLSLALMAFLVAVHMFWISP